MKNCIGIASAALFVGALTVPVVTHAADGGIVAHPDQLQYRPLTYQPPRAAEHRIKLKNGVIAYLVPDRSLPLVTVNVMMRIGPDLDPSGKEGLAAPRCTCSPAAAPRLRRRNRSRIARHFSARCCPRASVVACPS